MIEHKLNPRSTPEPTPPFADDGQEYPLFVTWNILATSSRTTATPRLRGCIGTFEPHALAQGLAEYASISAFKDSRFSPISPSELSHLECGVSLLTDFQECDDHLDWQVGVHGIYIHLPNPALTRKSLLAEDSASSSSGSGTSTPAPTWNNGRFASRRYLTATYLPDVIPEQGWSKLDAIDSAIRKAGFTGKITADVRNSLSVTRYRSDKVSCTYDQFVAWKQTL